jgi:hypothetical protein
MKKNIIYLIVFLILLAVAGWLLSENSANSTLDGPENYAFSVKDTAALTKIVITTKKPSSVTLEKRPGGWLIDGKDPVREQAMSTLLETLATMQLRNFVPKRMKDNIVNQLAVSGKKVELYKNGDLFKTIFVGNSTDDQLGTFMMLKNGDAPYAVYIPGFNGFLETRFITQPEVWQRRDLVRIKPRDIKEVKLTFTDSLEASFTLRAFSPDSLYMVSAATGNTINNLNQNKARQFLAVFKNLRYEGAITPDDGIYARKDSLLASKPAFSLRVKDIDGKVVNVAGYRIKNAQESIVLGDSSTYYDPDRLHGFINDQRMILLQYYGLRNVLLPIDYFKDNKDSKIINTP